MKNKILLMIFLLTVFSIATPAQVSPEQEIISAREQNSDIKNRSIELERMKRDAQKRPFSEDAAPRFPEIKEDFEQIQKINSEILRLTAVTTPTDYAAVLKFVSEINHRAARLKSNLFSAEAKAKNKQQTVDKPQNIKTLLDTLDKSIDSFVHNSIFQNMNVVNSTDSLKAQKDLENIIVVSNSIKSKPKN